VTPPVPHNEVKEERAPLSRTDAAALRTHDELVNAIRGLSDADWGRLRKTAATYALGRPIEAADLLQEAFRRALDGGRNCPAHVTVVKFLAEAMRSIAHGEKEKGDKKPVLVAIANHGDDEATMDPPDPGLDPEQIAISSEATAAIRTAMLALFEDDPIAQIIVEGLMEGNGWRGAAGADGAGCNGIPQQTQADPATDRQDLPRGMHVMTGDPKKERAALDRLADALVDDILNASDEDILAESTEEYGDPARLAAEMRAVFERTALGAGKAKLALAKQAAAEARRKGATVLRIDSAEARRRYERITSPLTLAARKGEGQSERDIDSAIEDLAELGAFEEDDGV
jgi:hypothetical protein